MQYNPIWSIMLCHLHMITATGLMFKYELLKIPCFFLLSQSDVSFHIHMWVTVMRQIFTMEWCPITPGNGFSMNDQMDHCFYAYNRLILWLMWIKFVNRQVLRSTDTNDLHAGATAAEELLIFNTRPLWWSWWGLYHDTLLLQVDDRM